MIGTPSSPAFAQQNHQQDITTHIDDDDDILSSGVGLALDKEGENDDSTRASTSLTDLEYWEEHKRKWTINTTSSKGSNSFKFFGLVRSGSKSFVGCPQDETPPHHHHVGGLVDENSTSFDFNPKDYSLVYDEVLKDRECSELFRTFLKMSRAEEPLEFMFACDEYKRFYIKWRENNMWCCREDSPIGSDDDFMIIVDDNVQGGGQSNIVSNRIVKRMESRKEQINKLITKVKEEVFERFINECAKQELHRGPLKTDLLKNWQVIIDQYNELSKGQTPHYTITEFNTQRITMNGLVNKLDPNILFSDLYHSAHLDLQVDLFPWFCKHPDLLHFLGRKGEEYTRTIAVRNYTFNILDWRIKERDLKDKVIKREHFYFGFSLLQDSKDWKLILDKGGLKAYVSKQVHTFDKNLANRMTLSKFSTTIPCSLEKFWKIWSNIETQQKLDFNCELQVKECNTNSSSQDLNPFAFGVVDASLKYHALLTTRKYRYLYTAIEEPSIDSIFMIGHSLQDDSSSEVEPALSKGFFFYLFKNLKDSQHTSVEICHYSDFKMSFSSLHNKLWIKQCKQFDKIIKNLSLSSTHTNHNDSLNYNKILQHNKEMQVSYYDSWMKLKNKQDH